MPRLLRGPFKIQKTVCRITLLVISAFRVVWAVNVTETVSESSTVKEPNNYSAHSQSSYAFNFQSGYTVIPQVLLHPNDKKWGSSKAKEAANSNGQCIPKAKKFENYSPVKPLDQNLTTLENPDSAETRISNKSALFGDVNDERRISGESSESDQIYNALRSHKIIPDVLDSNLTTMPLKHLKVTYGTSVVSYGTELYSLQIENEPTVEFKGENKTYYSLIAVGPDMPSYADHEERNWLHWCVGNIPGGNVSRGRVLAPYGGLTLGYELGKIFMKDDSAKLDMIHPGIKKIVPGMRFEKQPPDRKSKGPHRIVFLLYEQPKRKRLKFKESEFSDKLDLFRRGFYNHYTFVERYNLTGPIAVNFMIRLWENEIHQAGSLY